MILVKTSVARHLSRFNPGSRLEERISDIMLIDEVPVTKFEKFTG